MYLKALSNVLGCSYVFLIQISLLACITILFLITNICQFSTIKGISIFLNILSWKFVNLQKGLEDYNKLRELMYVSSRFYN